MKFFSHAWAARDDSEADQAPAAYARHLISLPGPAGEAARQVANAFALADALIDQVTLNRRLARLTVALVISEESYGYERLQLSYGDVLIETGAIEVARRAAESRLTRVRYDEFDRSDLDDGRLLHRFSFWPRRFGELQVPFRTLQILRGPLKGRHWTHLGEPFVDQNADDDSD